MTQFSVLTPETQTIVVNFFRNQKEQNELCDPNEMLMASLYSLMQDTDPKVLDIMKQDIVSLSGCMQESDISLLKSEYPAVVKFCFNVRKHSHAASVVSDVLYIPQSLTDLCFAIAEPASGSKVFVPYSGYGNFAYHVADCSIEGFEVNEREWAFSQILLHSQNASASIKLQHSLDSECGKYDYIYSFPPAITGSKGKEIVKTFYSLITEHLAENGELLCYLPLYFCTSAYGWVDVRRILLEYPGQYSATVISLPDELLEQSFMRFALLHIKNDHKGIITLMDATGEEFSDSGSFLGDNRSLRLNSVIESLRNKDERYVWVGDASQLNEYADLLPSHYLVSQVIPKPNEGEINMKLSDILQTVPLTRGKGVFTKHDARAERVSKHSLAFREAIEGKERLSEQGNLDCPPVGMKELSSSYLKCDIQREDLEGSFGGTADILTSDCLLIGFIGGKFKVGRLHGVTPESPVALRKEVIPVRIISDAVTEDFLLRCIMSESSARQAKMLSFGMSVTRLKVQDLLSVVISVPVLKEQQDALCREDTRSSLTEADRRIIESYEDFRKDMHMKKHAVGQTLFNLNNWWDVLQKARKEGNGVVSDSAVTGRVRKVSVASVYDSIEKALSQLQQQISRFDRGNGLEVRNFALTDFIEDYISRKQSPLFTFVYDKSLHHASKVLQEMDTYEESGASEPERTVMLSEEEPLEYVEFAPDALEIIFDNIVSNACCHGFKDRTDNVIRINLLTEGDSYVVVVSNNGSPIHEQIKPEEVFVYGRTSKMGRSGENGESHFGIGGYEVKKLMHEFGGDAELISDAGAEFPVSYRLTFYNTNI